MNLHFTGRNFELTPALKTHTEEKFAKLERFPNITNVNVVFVVEPSLQKVEANLHYSGFDIHAEASGTDMYLAVDAAVDKLLTQVSKHHEKITSHHG